MSNETAAKVADDRIERAAKVLFYYGKDDGEKWEDAALGFRVHCWDKAKDVIAALPAPDHGELVERLKAIRQREVQMLGAGLSKRNWHETEDAYNQLRDKIVGVLTDQHLAAQALQSTERRPSFQSRVQPWMMECFGPEIAADKEERNHRFLEEALELVQSCGCSASGAHQLVDYVYGRDAGEPFQESGGVMVTHAALCLANGLDMHADGETELARIWTKVEQIRAKQAGKPKHSPLPTPPQEQSI